MMQQCASRTSVIDENMESAVRSERRIHDLGSVEDRVRISDGCAPVCEYHRSVETAAGIPKRTLNNLVDDSLRCLTRYVVHDHFGTELCEQQCVAARALEMAGDG